MAHVKISTEHAGPGVPIEVVIDGVDMSRHILTTDFALRVIGDKPEEQQLGLQMVIAIDSLDVDLADAVVQALRESAPTGQED